MSGTVDASIPLRAIPAPTNPFQTITQFAGAANALNQNRIGQQTIQSNQLSLAQQQKQLAYAHLLPLIQAGRINNTADLTGALGALEHYGINTQPVTQEIVDTVSRGGDFVNNLKAQALAGAQEPANAAKAILPTPVDVNQGIGGIQVFNRAPPGMAGGGGLTPVGKPIAVGLSASEAAEPYHYTDATGKEIFTTKGGYAASHGINPSTIAPSGGASPLAGTNGRFYPATSTTPASPALRGPNAPPLPNPGANPGGPQPGPIPIGPAAQFAPNANGTPAGASSGPAVGAITTPEQSAKQYAADLANDQLYPTQKLNLDTALKALKSTTTGPSTEATNHILSFIQTVAPSMVPKQTTDAIENYDLAVKALAAVTRGLPGAQNSDMQQSLAQTAFASTHINNAAAQHVVQQAQGLLNMNHAGVSRFTKEQGAANAGNYTTWLNQSFTPNHHPLGFVFNDLPPAEQKALIKQYGGDRATLQAILNARNAAYGAPR